MKKGVGVSHAKTILLGEHSVVYGGPAIAFPIRGLALEASAEYSDDKNWLDTPFYCGEVPDAPRAGDPLEKSLAETAFRNVLSQFPQSDKKISLHVNGFIPPARGLGSSAAVAVAVIRAISDLKNVTLSDAELFELVQQVERVAHGTPSGLDAHATSKNIPIWFQNGEAEVLKFQGRPALLVADTGEEGRTAEAVSSVRELREKNKVEIDQQIDAISSLVLKAGTALREDDMELLGSLMFKNHEVLRSLGVSSPALDNLVDSAMKAGALGAKLTGGGLGGCIVALAKDENHLTEMTQILTESGASAVWKVY